MSELKPCAFYSILNLIQTEAKNLDQIHSIASILNKKWMEEKKLEKVTNQEHTH